MLGLNRPPDLSPLDSFFVTQGNGDPRDLATLRKAANTVTAPRVKISGTVPDGFSSDLTLTHRAMDQTLSTERLRLAKGRFEAGVHLLRGRNLITIESSGEQPAVFDVDLFYRTGLGEWIDSILRALVLVLVVKTYVVQAFYIPTPSMETTLLGHTGVHDYILVEKVSYLFRQPRAGEIVVFQYPLDPTKDFIKRMVAGQGDSVEVDGTRLILNGKPLDEPYARWRPSVSGDDLRDHFGPETVPQGAIFCMGDNRDNSRDSRWWGALPLWRMIGKAWGIYWPFVRLRVLDHHLGKPLIGPAPPPPPAPNNG